MSKINKNIDKIKKITDQIQESINSRDDPVSIQMSNTIKEINDVGSKIKKKNEEMHINKEGAEKVVHKIKHKTQLVPASVQEQNMLRKVCGKYLAITRPPNYKHFVKDIHKMNEIYGQFLDFNIELSRHRDKMNNDNNNSTNITEPNDITNAKRKAEWRC
jgi:hypothetical protein